MRLLFSGSCPKDPLGDDINEDKLAFSGSRGTLALCDGASESFDSSVWAQILADKFVLDPAVTPGWLSDAIAEYVARHDFAAMSWSRQASYERGSFSTLLGAQHIPGNKTVEVLAVGDSLAVLVDGSRFVSGWPYADPERFKDRPTLFATLPEHNDFVSTPGFWTERGTHFDLGTLESPRLVCVTDALGEWLLRQVLSGEDGLARLLALADENDLIELVVRERHAGRMRVDDSTLIVAAFDGEEALDGLPLV
ncbi:hypothetical protein [Rhodocyclus tenuis]|uniref:Protein phosphatase 2C domain-containing protein n=1 Tax=Rhodocyclus tenuis TaxID=1066 RepID=A0A840GK41_RHOTE|nr:hypothetical protein [Rhodocyclus tenuis]MBB4248802.1 hypothetical protein [Rhodocyclus tenuis]